MVNDDVYIVFKALESVTQRFLASMFNPTKKHIEKEKALTSFGDDDDVWSLVTIQTQDDVAQAVLKNISNSPWFC